MRETGRKTQRNEKKREGWCAGTSLLRARCFAAKKLEMNQSHVKRFIRFP